MNRLRATMQEHRHFLIVVTLLTLVMTFPTIIYAFKTDIFWQPAGSSNDVYIKFWDIWYGKQFLTGQANPFYTDLIFHPEGLPLNYHPFFIPHIIVVNALGILLPISNAFSLAYMLIVWSSALSAYIYLLWFFKDKWVASFGAIVFGFSPHVAGHPNHPEISFIATVPLIMYSFHRGVSEDRRALVLLAGLLTGLTTVISMYTYMCVLILLSFFLCAFAITRSRDKRFRLYVVLLVLSIAVSSLWRVYPMISGSVSIGEAAQWHGASEVKSDAISLFVNHLNPFFGRQIGAVLQTPAGAKLSETSFLGYVPLLLVAFGLFKSDTRRKMLPWVVPCTAFLILRLGSHLHINGTVFSDIPLPKYYLDQIPPGIFAAFWAVDSFIIGALLPFAVLTCFGLVALQKRLPFASKPMFIVALIVIISFEYYIPVRGKVIPDERIAYLDWLSKENGSGEIRLINLPMGRTNSKRYGLFQALSGYPHAEGAISRTPDSAFNYIRANYLLNAWYRRHPVSCETAGQDSYLSGLAQLETDGFSHIVLHHDLIDRAAISEDFRYVQPAYDDDSVSIYRLSDLRDSCLSELSVRH